MQNPWLMFLSLLPCWLGVCFATSASEPFRYMADSQSYTDSINNKIATNTLEASNLLLMQQLAKHYHHEFASLARIQYFMDNGEAVCIANKIKTDDRAAKYIFSHPVNVHISHRLYQQRHLPSPPPEVLNQQGEIISLNDLFAAQPLQTILLPFQRSFGEALDQQIALVPNKNKIIYQGGDLHDSEVDMFIKQRGDYLLTYPTTIYANDRALRNITMRSYAIAGQPKYIISRVMCANTPQTLVHIQKVNQALKRMYVGSKLLDTHLQWLPDTEHDTISTYFQQATDVIRH